jgi:hypothetical protein
MIAQIEIKTQYGNDTIAGINATAEAGDQYPAFAHSVQDAVEWLKTFPLYEGATIEYLSDGRVMVFSQWRERDAVFDALFVESDVMKAKYERSFVVIFPRNTIYENTGFQGYKAE